MILKKFNCFNIILCFISFKEKVANTSARVASTTVVATSLGSNSSSHDERVFCMGVIGLGSKIFKGNR